MKKFLFTLLLLSLVFTPKANASLIVNGGFEDPAITGNFNTITSGLTGWNIESGSVDLIRSYWAPNQPNQSLDLNGTSAGTISQSFATTPGLLYNVNFALAGNFDNNLGPKLLTVSAGNFSQQFSVAKPSGWSHSNMGWTAQTFAFKALESNTILKFKSDTPGSWGAALDNVSAAPIPEPASIFLGLMGLGGALGLRRRRKEQAI